MKKYWFVDLTILLVRFSVLLILAFNAIKITNSFSRESFEFDLGQKINILSDKAFRKSSENEFEAIGNVVITHLKNSIYGEKARINFKNGSAEIVGNVRYITPDVTLYGTALRYNFISREVDIDNARVLSENFVVTGKKIIQKSDNSIYAEEAEYTTCRDCPESWSVFGKVVSITVGKYIKIKHAFLKVNGVIAMYFPYVVFPIKQKRESGILFPLLGFSSKEGFRYQQPYFWAIGEKNDLTITPSTFGARGVGGDLQYRQSFGEKTWVELNTLQINDKIYEPFKLSKELSGKRILRSFSELEFNSSISHHTNGHFNFSYTSDLDTPRDLDFFLKEKIIGTEALSGGFLESRKSMFSLGVESYFNRNMILNDPKKFDDGYVQIVPKLSLSMLPLNIIHSPFPLLKNINLGFQSDYTIFKQNKISESIYIRNAQRLNFQPNLKWYLGNLGPIFLNHQVKLDYQLYNLKNQTDKKFYKSGIIYETEARFELEKLFGLSYTEIQNEKKIDKNIVLGENILGSLPQLASAENSVGNVISKNSYRHSQEFIFKHFYMSAQRYAGNSNFRNQIEKEDGMFDYLDSIRTKEYSSAQVTAQDSIPLSNTFEFQWNNKIIRKAPRLFDPFLDNHFLKDNFEYSNTGYFDLSQGINFDVNSKKLSDKLTRLYLNTGLSLNKFSTSIQEFYFHKTSEHKFTSSFGYEFSRAALAANFTYNSFNSTSTPVAKLAGYSVSISPNDLFTLKNSIDYNIQNKNIAKSSYTLLYSPLNNCWKVELSYNRDLIDKKLGVLFYINYNENNFTGFNVK
jgi:LPS-assembly protein